MIGRQLLHYRILEKLGEGGIGAVYRAEDLRLGRIVAVKMLSAGGAVEASSDLMLREARLASALSHPNIATVYDLCIDEETFIVFEYVPGGTLRDHLDSRSTIGEFLSAGDLIDFGLQIAAGLAHAHGHGVVHGDIKTENVLLTDEGAVKIADFGVGTLLGEDQSLRPEGGTLAYMAPEQIRGESIDHRSDLFSLGVLLFELATGRLPFRGTYGPAIEYAILNEEPVAITTIRSDLPASLADVIARLLHKEPEQRFQNAAQVIASLAEVKLQTTEVQKRGVSKEGEQITIAVLPLANRSADAEHEYLVDGITEEIIWALTKVEGLRVVAPATSFAFKGSAEDIRSIGSKLGVSCVLEGSVRSGGERLRITVHLVDVASGFDIWSERYDRQSGDLLALQEEIARTIVETLRGQLAGAADRPLLRTHTHNLDAYTLYLKGRFEQHRRTAEGLTSALNCFQMAVAIDPSYALGYTGLADTYALMSWYGGSDPGDSLRRAKAAAEQALRLDDALGEAHASMALILQEHDWDWEGSEREFKRALELNPGYALAHHWFGLLLTRMGRFDEARAEIELGLQRDPLSLTANLGLGVHLYSARRYSEAIEQLLQTLQLDRNYYPALYFLGMAYEQVGRFAEALALLQRAADLQDNLETLALLCHACAVSGDELRSDELLLQLRVRSEARTVSAYSMAMIHTARGSFDEAFRYLEQGYRDRSVRMLFLNVDPAFDPVRTDPRFDEMLKRIGLTS